MLSGLGPDGLAYTASDGAFRYTPPAKFAGWDSFNVTLTDETGSGTERAWVHVDNRVPQAKALDLYTAKSRPRKGRVEASDDEADIPNLTYRLAVWPSHGTVDMATDGTFTYIPDADFIGVDRFSYLANDGIADGGLATVDLTVVDPEITDVYWAENRSPITPNVHPIAGYGVRVFPDRESPEDTVRRDSARVRATINAPVPGVLVYFWGFDVDDPSSDHPDLDANGTAGGDNRDKSANGMHLSALTDENGVAEVVVPVGVRPGDNYRYAAALDQADMQGLTDNNVSANDEQTPAFEGLLSPLMTVWRRLHVESDRMQTNTGLTGNRVEGRVLDARGEL